MDARLQRFKVDAVWYPVLIVSIRAIVRTDLSHPRRKYCDTAATSTLKRAFLLIGCIAAEVPGGCCMVPVLIVSIRAIARTDLGHPKQRYCVQSTLWIENLGLGVPPQIPCLKVNSVWALPASSAGTRYNAGIHGFPPTSWYL